MATDHARSLPRFAPAKAPKRYPHRGRRGGIRTDAQGVTAHALNESISDVFGSLVKQYKLGQTVDAADWLIGAGTLGPALHGVALRSMRAPGTAYDGDNQPSTMNDYVVTAVDNGGVHTNSGIPNHAFYVAARSLGGYAWERAGRIWYQVMASRSVPQDAQFHTFARATIVAAAELYGADSPELRAVAEAWIDVGVLTSAQLPTGAAERIRELETIEDVSPLPGPVSIPPRPRPRR